MTETKNRLWCQAQDCDDPIENDDDVVWTNYQQGEVFHRECFVTDDS